MGDQVTLKNAFALLVKAFGDINPVTEEELQLDELLRPSDSPETKFEAADVELAKAVIDTEDKQQFMAVVLRPNKLDADNNFYSEVTVEKACHDFNEHCRTANIQHLFDTTLMYPAESYIAPADFTVEDQVFLKGDWIMVSDIRSEDLWDMCKSGEFTGYSIGCPGKVLVPVEEETD